MAVAELRPGQMAADTAIRHYLQLAGQAGQLRAGLQAIANPFGCQTPGVSAHGVQARESFCCRAAVLCSVLALRLYARIRADNPGQGGERNAVEIRVLAWFRHAVVDVARTDDRQRRGMIETQLAAQHAGVYRAC